MSLDARLEKIARDEVARALAGADSAGTARQDSGLEQEVRDLHEHLHRALTQISHLAERVKALESAPTTTQAAIAEAKPTRRSSSRSTTP